MILESNILGTYFTATSLTMGTAYRFKVSARNSVGYSLLSEEVSILAAQEPN
jgi:hypothetical protein